MSKREPAEGICFVVFELLVFILGCMLIIQFSKIRQIQSEFADLKAKYRNYCHETIDGVEHLSLDGRHWYRVLPSPARMRKNGDLTTVSSGGQMLEPADNESVRHHLGRKSMTEYVREHGPLDPRNPEHRKVLEEAGFEIKEKP